VTHRRLAQAERFGCARYVELGHERLERDEQLQIHCAEIHGALNINIKNNGILNIHWTD
jgi:hypothetical protein